MSPSSSSPGPDSSPRSESGSSSRNESGSSSRSETGSSSPSETGSSPPSSGSSRDDRRGRLRSAVARRVGIDARALAAFRIAVGSLVLADLLFRARDLPTFYTDAGVLPRATHAEVFPLLARLSIHAQVGSTAGQSVLFLAAGSLAVALVAGYRTRLATVGVAALHASMHARNTHLMNGGDGLLVLALFLGVFLPLGRRWSLDALRDGAAGVSGVGGTASDSGEVDATTWTRVANLATATLLVQLVVVYLANAAFKLQSDAWMDGTAVQMVLELEQFAVRLGPSLTAYPTLLVAVNWLWLAMLLASPLLVLATGWRRTLAVAGFAVAHLGMLATMRLGFFPLVVVALLLLYLPPGVWERVDRRVVAGRTAPASVRRLSEDRPRTAWTARLPPDARRAGRVAVTVLLAVVLLGSVLWPVTALGVVDADAHDPVPDPDGYTWTLFAPNPPSETRWFVAPATLDDGTEIDALDGSAVDWEPPADAAETYPGTLWHRYLNDMRVASEVERTALAAHLCRRAGGYTDATVTEVAVYAVERPVDSVGGGDAVRTELVRHDCTTAG